MTRVSQHCEFWREWVDFILHSGKDLVVSEIEEDISRLYAKIELPKPQIQISESYLQHKMNIAWLKEKERRGGLAQRIRASITQKLENQMDATSDKDRTYPLGHAVQRAGFNMPTLSAVKKELAPVRTAIMNDADSQLKRAQLEFVKQGFGLGNEYWLSLCYDLIRAGQADECLDLSYYHLMAKGIMAADFFEKTAFVCKLPFKVLRNRRLSLHSTSEPAIQWRDGTGLYYIDGVSFERQLWQDIIARNLSCKQILKLRNIEQRRIALMLHDPEQLIIELEGRLVHTSERGNQLYAFKKIIHKKTVWMLKYKDPSTDRIYVSFVPDGYSNADSAMAWKFFLGDQDYKTLTEEA